MMTLRLLYIAAGFSVLSTTMALAAETMPTADVFLALSGAGARLSTPDDPGTTYSIVTFGGQATAEFAFTPHLGAQGDLVVRKQRTTIDQSPDGVDDVMMDAAGHLFYRDDRLLLGVIGQIGRDSLSADGAPDFYAVDRVIGGAEGQVFLGNATLYAQAGAEHLTDQIDYEDGWFANLTGRYFLTPDLEVEAHGGVETVANSGTNKGFFGFDTILTVVRGGAGIDYRVADTPFSLFARYDHYHTMFNRDGVTADEDRFLIGAKVNFGADTLLARDRSGASLNPVESHVLDLLSSR